MKETYAISLLKLLKIINQVRDVVQKSGGIIEDRIDEMPKFPEMRNNSYNYLELMLKYTKRSCSQHHR